MRFSLGLTVLFFLFTGLTFASEGVINGNIFFEGKVPTFKPIRMESDAICVTSQTGKTYPQTLVVGQKGELANVIVKVLNPPLIQTSIPQEPIIIDQKGCNYSPHVNIIRLGQKVKILNPDGTLHNVHSLSKVNKPFNLSMPKFRKELEQVFDKIEAPFALKCDVHPWMIAWLTVVDNPFTVLSDTQGKFEIKGLPDGRYDLEAWHERLGVKKFQVDVKDGKADDVTFKFTMQE